MGRAVFLGKLPLSGAVGRPIDPLILSQTRTSFSLLVLLPVLAGRRGWQRVRLPMGDLVQCLILGMLGVAVSNYFYYVAIQRTSVAIAIIVQYTAPVWVLLYVVARGQQKLSLQKVAAVARRSRVDCTRGDVADQRSAGVAGLEAWCQTVER